MLFGQCSIFVTSMDFLNDVNISWTVHSVLFWWYFNLSWDFLDPQIQDDGALCQNSDLQFKLSVINGLILIDFPTVIWLQYLPRKVRAGTWTYLYIRINMGIFINLAHPGKGLSILLNNQSPKWVVLLLWETGRERNLCPVPRQVGRGWWAFSVFAISQLPSGQNNH